MEAELWWGTWKVSMTFINFRRSRKARPGEGLGNIFHFMQEKGKAPKTIWATQFPKIALLCDISLSTQNHWHDAFLSFNRINILQHLFLFSESMCFSEVRDVNKWQTWRHNRNPGTHTHTCTRMHAHRHTRAHTHTHLLLLTCDSELMQLLLS